MSIQEKSLRILEYPKIIELLTEEALSAPGKKACAQLRPLRDIEAIEHAQHETDDMVRLILQDGTLPLSSFEEVMPWVERINVGSIPGCPEFMMFARFLRTVKNLKARLPHLDTEAEEAIPLWVERVRMLDPLTPVLERIEQCVAGDDEVHDKASPELYSIRRSIIRAQDSIKDQLDRIIKSHGSILQDSIVTLRGERYVVPVKAEHKGDLPGLVHDTSASGATYFIEPLAVVELNNKIRELKAEERNEIRRIFAELARMIGAESDAFAMNSSLLVTLDFAQAKAKLAINMKAFRPTMNTEGIFDLKAARHPLIPRDEVVPIDFKLGETFRTLVITGPNTGGKTVTLKTCGLLCLMAMSGLQIPASELSRVPVFERVLADIGDEQSIEQSLSTFSSHLKQIVQILEVAGPNTLVLADELGAGTDPSEGAALAISILDHLRSAGCHTVATTHYKELKGYAINTPGVENACCEFDTETLRPTYKLLIGVPGVSNAFAISKRLGLPDAIIADAEALISDEGAQFEELVAAIEQSHHQAATMRDEIETLRREAEELRDNLEADRAKFEQRKKEQQIKAKEEAYRILTEAEREAADMLEEFKQSMKHAKHSSVSELHDIKRGIDEKRTKLSEELGEAHLKQGVDRVLLPEDIVVGQRYEAVGLGIEGVAVAPPDNKDQVQLQNGTITVSVPIKALRPQQEAKPSGPSRRDRRRRKSASAPRGSATAKMMEEKHSSVQSELKLLGFRVDEALRELDSFLDDAVLTGITSARIVHGKGTGALREAVRSELRGDPRVTSFREAAFGEGDSGVTIVELKG